MAALDLAPNGTEPIRVKIPEPTLKRLAEIEAQIASLQTRHGEILITAIEGQGYMDGIVSGFDPETKEVLLNVMI